MTDGDGDDGANSGKPSPAIGGSRAAPTTNPELFEREGVVRCREIAPLPHQKARFFEQRNSPHHHPLEAISISDYIPHEARWNVMKNAQIYICLWKSRMHLAASMTASSAATSMQSAPAKVYTSARLRTAGRSYPSGEAFITHGGGGGGGGAGMGVACAYRILSGIAD